MVLKTIFPGCGVRAFLMLFLNLIMCAVESQRFSVIIKCQIKQSKESIGKVGILRQCNKKLAQKKNQKPKNILHFVDCSKVEITKTMAEMLDPIDEKSNETDEGVSTVDSKLDKILEQIKPIDSISSNVKTLTEKLEKLELTISGHGSRIERLEKCLELTDMDIQNMKGKIQGISEDVKCCKESSQENSLWKTKCEMLEESLLKLETYSRKENIIFEGLEESDNENCADIIISPDESRGYIGFRSVAPPPPP